MPLVHPGEACFQAPHSGAERGLLMFKQSRCSGMELKGKDVLY